MSTRISAGVDDWPCITTFYCYDPYSHPGWATSIAGVAHPWCQCHFNYWGTTPMMSPSSIADAAHLWMICHKPTNPHQLVMVGDNPPPLWCVMSVSRPIAGEEPPCCWVAWAIYQSALEEKYILPKGHLLLFLFASQSASASPLPPWECVKILGYLLLTQILSTCG